MMEDPLVNSDSDSQGPFESAAQSSQEEQRPHPGEPANAVNEISGQHALGDHIIEFDLAFLAAEQRMFWHAIDHLGSIAGNRRLIAKLLSAHYEFPSSEATLTPREREDLNACGLTSRQLVTVFQKIAALYLTALDKQHGRVPGHQLKERIESHGIGFPYEDADDFACDLNLDPHLGFPPMQPAVSELIGESYDAVFSAQEERIYMRAMRAVGHLAKDLRLVQEIMQAHYSAKTPGELLELFSKRVPVDSDIDPREIVTLVKELAKNYLSSLDRQLNRCSSRTLERRVDGIGELFSYNALWRKDARAEDLPRDSLRSKDN